MINFVSFSDELQKIAVAGYRAFLGKAMRTNSGEALSTLNKLRGLGLETGEHMRIPQMAGRKPGMIASLQRKVRANPGARERILTPARENVWETGSIFPGLR